MKTHKSHLVSLCLIMLLGLMLVNPVGAEELFFSVEGSQSGKFPGEITQAGFEGTMKAVKYESELTTQQGSVAGRVGMAVHGPIKLTKKMGAASLSFFNALKVGEMLTITIEFFSPSRAGKIVNTHTVTLKNARVAGIRQYSEPIGQVPGAMVVLEELSFAFGDYEMKDMFGGASSQSQPPRIFRK